MEPPAAVLIFLHGFSDHCNRYFDFYSYLAESGILVHSFDQRGWGRSVKKQSDRGLTGPTSQVVADITSFIESKLPGPAPLFLMGHSMGGQECLFYAATGPAETKKHIVGFLVEGPWIRLDPSSQPNMFTMFAGKLASRLLPHKQLVQKLESKYMCHDLAMCKDWEQDPLCHDTGTLEGLAGCLERAEALDKGEVKIDEACHLYMGHGREDHVTSHQASKEFFERLIVKDKTLKLYDGCYHCSEYRSNKLYYNITK